MVESYHENGAYFVIAPQIAIPHARPTDGVENSAVSLVVLKDGVNFGHAANDPVRLVFGLAATSSEAHLKVIQKSSPCLVTTIILKNDSFRRLPSNWRISGGITMKILAVCGLGQGTSLILRMNVETVLRDMGVDADVEHIDVSAARSMNVDIIVTSQELAETLGTDTSAKVVIVNNYFDNAEIKNALSAAINS